MARGINRADPLEEISRRLDRLIKMSEGREVQEDICVFISHKREDTEDCLPIAEYLKNAEIDVYFDEYDQTLTEIVESGDPDKLTERLQEGIDNSTHMICVVSPETITSYWVPFEVGYGYRHTVLGILTLKGLTDYELPEYMRITRVIRGSQSLDGFIAEVLEIPRERLEERKVLQKYGQADHPLSEVLDWWR